MKHQQPTEKWRELIVLYALGLLSPEQATAFEDRLAEGCKTCNRLPVRFAVRGPCTYCRPA